MSQQTESGHGATDFDNYLAEPYDTIRTSLVTEAFAVLVFFRSWNCQDCQLSRLICWWQHVRWIFLDHFRWSRRDTWPLRAHPAQLPLGSPPFRPCPAPGQRFTFCGTRNVTSIPTWNDHDMYELYTIYIYIERLEKVTKSLIVFWILEKIHGKTSRVISHTAHKHCCPVLQALEQRCRR